MDPDENIREQLELADEIESIADNEDRDTDDLLTLERKAVRLAELVKALDAWRKTGGFDPYAK
jgi:hypothetical protein